MISSSTLDTPPRCIIQIDGQDLIVSAKIHDIRSPDALDDPVEQILRASRDTRTARILIHPGPRRGGFPHLWHDADLFYLLTAVALARLDHLLIGFTDEQHLDEWRILWPAVGPYRLVALSLACLTAKKVTLLDEHTSTRALGRKLYRRILNTNKRRSLLQYSSAKLVCPATEESSRHTKHFWIKLSRIMIR